MSEFVAVNLNYIKDASNFNKLYNEKRIFK